MHSQLHGLLRRYAATLPRYLAGGQEVVLAQAYELGRQAVARGLGVLDMGRVHHAVLQESLPRLMASASRERLWKAVETFFLESLSPFEMTHRGFRQTNVKLQELIATLERRNLQLAESNRELKREIRERQRTEAALRESEEHLRELFHEARRMEENLRSLSNQILHVQEEERKRISRELHDEVGQALTAISVMLATLKSHGAGAAGHTERRLADAQHLLRATMETVHRFARELRPAILDELGLLPALRSCLKAFADRTGLTVRFRSQAIAETLSAETKTVLFRVAQECLTNVAKHAKASRVMLRLWQVADGICMEVADDGRSFRASPERTTKGLQRLGLLGMQERVRLVRGNLTIDAQPGRGTTIRVAIPIHSLGPLTLEKRLHAGPRPAGRRRDRTGARPAARKTKPIRN